MPADVIKCTVYSAIFSNKDAYANHNKYYNSSDLYIITDLLQEQKHNISKVLYKCMSQSSKRRIKHRWNVSGNFILILIMHDMECITI